MWPIKSKLNGYGHKIQNGYGVYLLRWVSKSGVGSGEKGNLNEVGYGAVHLSTWQSMHDDVSMCRNQPRYHMFGGKNMIPQLVGFNLLASSVHCSRVSDGGFPFCWLLVCQTQ